MGFLLTLALGLVALALFLWWHVLDRYSYFCRHQILHIPPSFPAGNFQGVSQKLHVVSWIYEHFLKFNGRDKISGYFFGTAPNVMILDKDTAYEILVKEYNVFPSAHRKWNDPLSSNLTTMEGAQWRAIRTKLSPVFSSMSTGSVIESLRPVGDDLIDFVDRFADNPETPINVRDLFVRYISDALSSSVLGGTTTALREDHHPLMSIGERMFKPRGSRDFLIFLLIVSYANFFRKLPIRLLPSNIGNDFIRTMEEAMKRRVESRNAAPRNDLLDLLVRIEQAGCLTDDETGEVLAKITHNQLLGHAFMTFVIGFITSRVTLNFCLYELVKNPEIQGRLRGDILTALPEGEEITYEALESIPYLQQVVDETLRKYAPGAWIERRAKVDYKVKNSSHVIAKDMKIVIPVMGFHNDPHVYENPREFIPERMTKEKISRRHPCSFMPFGIGNRGCLAQRVAYLYVKLGIVLLLRRFRFSLNARTEMPLNFSPNSVDMMPASGILLDVQRCSGVAGAAERQPMAGQERGPER